MNYPYILRDRFSKDLLKGSQTGLGTSCYHPVYVNRELEIQESLLKERNLQGQRRLGLLWVKCLCSLVSFGRVSLFLVFCTWNMIYLGVRCLLLLLLFSIYLAWCSLALLDVWFNVCHQFGTSSAIIILNVSSVFLFSL